MRYSESSQAYRMVCIENSIKNFRDGNFLVGNPHTMGRHQRLLLKPGSRTSGMTESREKLHSTARPFCRDRLNTRPIKLSSTN